MRRHRLQQDHPELLLPVEGRQRGEHQTRGLAVDARQLVVRDPATKFDEVGHAEVLGHLAEPPLLGPDADDQQPRRRRSTPPQHGEGADHVLMPLLPDEPADRQDEMGLARRAGRPGCGEAVDVDPRRRDRDLAWIGPLEQESRPRALGGGQEQIGRREHRIAVRARAHVAVGAPERQRLPHRDHEPEAELCAKPSRLGREPVAQLGGVHDVGARKVLLERQVALADRSGEKTAHAPAREPAANGLDPGGCKLEAGHVVLVVRRHENRCLELGAEVLPRTQIPRIRRRPSQDHHPRRHDARRIRRAL